MSLIRIAVDAFGGDHAPEAVLEGCAQALRRHDDFTLLLCGDEARLRKALEGRDCDMSRVEIRHAPDVIGYEEAPVAAIKKKKNASLTQAFYAMGEGAADGLLSAGSTGALLAGATLITRRMEGVKRPALATMMPTRSGGRVLVADIGANVDCKPSYLMQFAVMADAYLRSVEGVERPRIGLLNNGTEAEKGNQLTKAAYALLQDAPLHFAGNCEARDVLGGAFDAVVCDGFAGNVLLKHTEGMAAAMMDMLKAELMADLRSKLGAALSKPAFRRFKKQLDYTEYGGAPLLGARGCVIKAHGSSNAKAFASALEQARRFISADVNAKISASLAALPQIED